MKFEPFKMAQISAQWPAGELKNMHSSNPEPLTWDQLQALLNTDLTAAIKNTPFAYESTQGSFKLRSSLCDVLHSKLLAENLVLTSGAQEGIYLVMNALLNPADHVICFTPCFEPLAKVASDTGAEVSLLPLIEKSGWGIDWELLESSFKDNTQLLVINFPHNPTGTHISSNELDRLIQLCEEHDCWLLSDEVFRGLEHEPADRLPSAADCYHKAIALGVVSKSLALPGVRVGWVATQNHDLIQKIMTIKSHLSICQSSLDVELCQHLIPHSARLWERNRLIIIDNKYKLEKMLSNHTELYWQSPKAAATGFVQLKNHQNANELAINWANNHHFTVMPNTAFLTPSAGFRLTLGQINADKYYRQIKQDDGVSDWP